MTFGLRPLCKCKNYIGRASRQEIVERSSAFDYWLTFQLYTFIYDAFFLPICYKNKSYISYFFMYLI